MFEAIKPAPPDAILGITEAFRKDPSPNKINLSVGVYKDESGATPILPSVREAKRRLLDAERDAGYLPIDGDARFNRLVSELVLTAESPLLADGRTVTMQTPGGTGALRVAADLLHRVLPDATVWVTNPTWPNHPKVFQAAGLRVERLRYFDSQRNELDFDGLLEDLEALPAGDVVCLHGCCHNPTGADPSPEQWSQIAQMLQERAVFPLLDFAYQGFGRGLDEDAQGVRTVLQQVPEAFVAVSFSKNFGLYRERTGGLITLAEEPEHAANVLSQLKACARANYSNPPYHGAAVVKTILDDDELRQQWLGELAQMRDRIRAMRTLFVRTMSELRPDRDFSFIERQNGMFSFSGLTPEQVDRLRDEFSVYVVRNGRINVGGMTPENMRRLCEAIAAVL